MFCPKCGNADQKPETYCRQCGEFLTDFDKKGKKATSPESHIKVNTVLNLLSGIISLTLAILLYWFFLGKENTPPIIYITAGFLLTIAGWQVQTFWRMMLLKKYFKRLRIEKDAATEMPEQTKRFTSARTKELLNEADFTNNVPASVVENTTKILGDKIERKSSQTEH